MTKLHLRLGGFALIGGGSGDGEESDFLRPRRPRNHLEALNIFRASGGELTGFLASGFELALEREREECEGDKQTQSV